MAYVFRTKKKDGTPHPRWRFEYRDWQGRRRKGTGFTSKAETVKLANRVQANHEAIRKGHLPPPKSSAKPRPFAEVVDEYLAWGKSQGGRGGRPWGDVHQRMREAHLRWWQRQLKSRMLADLQGCLPQVEKALYAVRAAGRANKTLANYAEAISAFCKWCVDREYLDDDPLRRLAAFDMTPREIRRAMTVEEIGRVLAVADPEQRLLYEVAFCTGLRAKELQSLTVAHLDVENEGVRLEAAWTKNRKDGFQPLPRSLVERLAAEAAGKPATAPLLIVPSHPSREFDKDLKAAGVPKRIPGQGKVDFHACRTAYATFVVESGASVKEAQTLLRHSTPNITMNTYARVRESRLNSVAQKVGELILGDGTNPKEPQSPPPADSGTTATPAGDSGCDQDASPTAAGKQPEPGKQLTSPTTGQPWSPSGQHSTPKGTQRILTDYPELARVLQTWTTLSLAVKAGILAMVDADDERGFTP